MRKSRFSEAQIIAILKELDAGTPASELGRSHGVHPNTISAWKAKYRRSDVVVLLAPFVGSRTCLCDRSEAVEIKHSALGYRTPREFSEQFETTQISQLSVA